MKKLLIAIAAATISMAANAADLAVKAPLMPAVICAPQNCSGFYAGFGFIANGSNVDIVGQGLNQSIFSMGGVFKVQGGYQLWSGPFFAAFDFSVGYQFTTTNNSNVTVTPTGSKFIATELIKLGYNFFPSPATATTVPGQSPTSLLVPANLMAASTPYFTGGAMQRYGQSQGVMGAGVQIVPAAGWSVDMKYLYAPTMNNIPATNVVVLELNKHF